MTSGAQRPCPQCAATCESDDQYCAKCGFPVGSVSLSNQDPFVGSTLPGGYQILDLISVGGMGRVYRAEQSVLGRTVAVKVVHPHLLSEDSSIARFLTEARAASQLNHPHSVSVIDFGRTEDGQPYLVMELLRGKDLGRVAYEQGPLPIRRIVTVLSQVMLALEEAHELGIVHRDLKPENIILEPTRRGGDFVKVVDFGLAKLKEGPSTSVTLPGIVCGTPDYMAPEQGRGDDIDGRSDLYAVGVVLFQLLTGRLPFDADTPTKVVLKHMNDPIPDPRDFAPNRDIGEELVQVVKRALAKLPGQRYQNANEFILALEAATQVAVAPAKKSDAPIAIGDCPTCGATVPLTRFCQECGARLPSKKDREAIQNLVGDLRFVGRDDDLAWLERQFTEAQREGGAVKLIGEAGVGKTRLMSEFLEWTEVSGSNVVKITPDPWWARVAFHGLRTAISELTGCKTLEELLSTLRGQEYALQLAYREIYTGLPENDDERLPEAKKRGYRLALEHALERSTRVGAFNTVVAIDDIDHLDNPSIDAFAEVANRPRPGLLLLATHPTSFDPGWTCAATRLVNGLSPMTVARLLPANPLIERALATLEVGARGLLPLHIKHLLGFIADGGTDAPPRVADLIAMRLNNLETTERDVVQVLSVLGDHVKEQHLRQVLELQVDVEALLRALTSKGFISRSEDTLSLQHPTLHALVAFATPAEVRRELHQRARSYLDKIDAPIEVRALHACASRDALESLMLLEQVAERAAARGDEKGRVDALRKALDVAREQLFMGELDDPMRAVAIFGRKLGDALTNTGYLSDAQGVLKEALDMTGPAGTERAQLLLSLAKLAHARAQSDEALELLEEASRAAGDDDSGDFSDQLEAVREAWAI